MPYLSNKKRILKIRRLELILEEGNDRQTDISPMSKHTFHFLNKKRPPIKVKIPIMTAKKHNSLFCEICGDNLANWRHTWQEKISILINRAISFNQPTSISYIRFSVSWRHKCCVVHLSSLFCIVSSI